MSATLWVALGGALGSVGRYWLALLTLPLSKTLPWGTIGINVTGSFVIGFFAVLTLSSGRLPMSENARVFILVGLCGGYTTFSTFSFQTFELLRNGFVIRAGLNIVISLVLCLLAVAAGYACAIKLNG